MNLYLCRDCLTTFTGWPDMHPGDQFCGHCTQLHADSIAQARVRQDNLEEMGFGQAEAEADMREWLESRR